MGADLGLKGYDLLLAMFVDSVTYQHKCPVFERRYIVDVFPVHTGS